MACPICGEQCRCAEPAMWQGHSTARAPVRQRAIVSSAGERVLADPDPPDDSEEQFACSALSARIMAGEPAASSAGNAPGTMTQAHATLPGIENNDPVWRDEVASRVHSYRARRRRRAHDASLHLDFDPDAQNNLARDLDQTALRRAAILERVAQQAVARAAQAQMQAEPEPLNEDNEVEPWDQPAATPSPECESEQPVEVTPEAPTRIRLDPAPVYPRPEPRKIIEFPRAPDFGPLYELAEPVLDTPRILDVPEAVPNSAPAPLADVALEAEPEYPPAPKIEIPLRVAPMTQRVFAALLDAVVVLTACGTFGFVALHVGAALPHSRPGLALAAAVPLLIWAIYQYVFLVYAVATPGMQMAKIGICTFDDEHASQRVRRLRALATVLSAVSLGLGYLWALVDDDTLCWHDRITRSYSRLLYE